MRRRQARPRAVKTGCAAGVAVLLLIGCWSDGGGAWQNAAPDAELSPAAVVAAQLEALRNNDKKNTGIEVAFRFSSPGNRQSTGPLERFVMMIHDGPYELLLGFDSAHAAPVEIEGPGARQSVTVVRDGAVRVYHFLLSKQNGGPCDGCWMTDTVLVEERETEAI